MSTAGIATRIATAALTLLLGACAGLRPGAAPQSAFYALDPLRAEATATSPPGPGPARPSLIVEAPRAGSGFDSRRIVYLRQPHRLEYFANSEWVDTPARMLAPLIVAALDRGGSFRAVLRSPGAATADLRLDTEILRLQQDFAGPPSRVRLTLRATVVDDATRRVLAWREFDVAVAAASEDAHGGVLAASAAVQAVLEQLAGFCREATANWQPAATTR